MFSELRHANMCKFMLCAENLRNGVSESRLPDVPAVPTCLEADRSKRKPSPNKAHKEHETTKSMSTEAFLYFACAGQGQEEAFHDSNH